MGLSRRAAADRPAPAPSPVPPAAPQDDSESPALTDDDRTAIKAGLVRLMLSVPPLVQRQVSDALAHISRFDFPALWPTLLPELVAELAAATDYAAMLGLLETVCAVFERFRGAYDSDENRGPLKYAVDTFALPLMERYRLVQTRAEAAAREGAPAAEQAALADARRLMCTCFFLLNWLDLPEVFEDNLGVWVGWFHAALVEQNAATSSAADADEAGALEQLKGAALEAVELYAQKYEEEFEPHFGLLLTDVWRLLAGGDTPAAKLLSPNMDGLVTRAIKFVTSVAGKDAHRAVFAQDGFIGALLTQVVVPNMQLRAQELEDFGDNPEDFMRGDIEGNNADTRRRVATDLVRALCRTHNAITTPMCVGVVDRMLAEYEAAKEARAPAKDAAVALFGALAAKTATEALGVTAVNELADLGTFLGKHVLPELQGAASPDERPLAKAAAIKFIATFRGLFSREQLLALLPLLVPFMQAQSVVVHTYSAAAVERILNVKDPAPAGAPRSAAAPRVSAEALRPMLPQLLTHLFAHIARPGYPENEYLMRCVLRAVVVAGGPGVAPLAAQIIQALTAVLVRVCANPANPVFNHSLFETVASLMRSVCAQRAEAAADFEAMLMPPFQGVLSKDVAEFLPYVFQLLAELLELRAMPAGAGAGPGAGAGAGAAAPVHALSDGFRALLAPCLAPPLWQRRACVPALTDLLVAFLHKGAAYIAGEAGQLLPLLGVWQKLMTTKNQEQFAFALLNALVTSLPTAALQQHLVGIMQVTLTRVQQSKAIKMARLFVHSAALVAGAHGPAVLEGALEALGAGTFAQVVESVVCVTGNRIPQEQARREAAVGLARLLCEAPSLSNGPARYPLWQKLLCLVIELATGGPPPDAAAAAAALAAATAAAQLGGGALGTAFAEEDEGDSAAADVGAEELPAEYQAAFSRLRHAAVRRAYAFQAQAPDARVFVGASLAALATRLQPGLVAQLVGTSPAASVASDLVLRAGGRL